MLIEAVNFTGYHLIRRTLIQTPFYNYLELPAIQMTFKVQFSPKAIDYFPTLENSIFGLIKHKVNNIFRQSLLYCEFSKWRSVRLFFIVNVSNTSSCTTLDIIKIVKICKTNFKIFFIFLQICKHSDRFFFLFSSKLSMVAFFCRLVSSNSSENWIPVL